MDTDEDTSPIYIYNAVMDQNIQIPSVWSNLVESATSYDSWCRIIHHMFDDGIINLGRLVTLHRYTQDVIENLKRNHHTDSTKIANRYRQGILNIVPQYE